MSHKILKNEALDLIKIKTFCSVKAHVKNMKRQGRRNWEKRFTNHMSDEGLVLRIQIEFSEINSENNNKNPQTIQLENRQENPQRDISQMANKHVKRYLTSLTIKKI